MDDGNTRAVQAMGDAPAKARGIDGNDRVRLEAPRSIDGLVEPPYQARQMRQHLGQPHERELSHGKKTLESFAFALRAADAGEADMTSGLGLEHTHQRPGEVVARSLARYHEDQRLARGHCSAHIAIKLLAFCLNQRNHDPRRGLYSGLETALSVNSSTWTSLS